MSRCRLIAGAWLLASGVSLLLAVVLIGCCALPFHDVVHRWMPVCHMAQAALSTHPHGSHDDHEPPASPPPQKREQPDLQRLSGKIEPRSPTAPVLLPTVLARVPGPIAHRSQFALGAMRCDDDVGLRLALLDTLRI